MEVLAALARPHGERLARGGDEAHREAAGLRGRHHRRGRVDRLLEVVARVAGLSGVEHHHRRRLARVDVLAHHQRAGARRALPVDAAHVVAGRVLAQRVEREHAVRGGVRHRPLEVAGPPATARVDGEHPGLDEQRDRVAHGPLGPPQPERVVARDGQRAHHEGAATVRGDLVRHGHGASGAQRRDGHSHRPDRPGRSAVGRDGLDGGARRAGPCAPVAYRHQPVGARPALDAGGLDAAGHVELGDGQRRQAAEGQRGEGGGGHHRQRHRAEGPPEHRERERAGGHRQTDRGEGGARRRAHRATPGPGRGGRAPSRRRARGRPRA